MNHIIKSQKPLKGNKKTATCAVYFPPVRQTFCRTGFSWCYSVVVVLPLRLQALQTLLLELFQLTKALRVIFNLDSSLHSTKGITNNLMADIVTRVLSDHPEVSEPRENNLAHGNSPCRQAAAKAKDPIFRESISCFKSRRHDFAVLSSSCKTPERSPRCTSSTKSSSVW